MPKKAAEPYLFSSTASLIICVVRGTIGQLNVLELYIMVYFVSVHVSVCS